MKAFLSLVFCSFLMLTVRAQNTAIKKARPDSTKKIFIAEAACGECQFHMPGKDCELAVRINGKSYFVDGTGIDNYGNAHAKDGFCKAIRKAEVQGEIVNNQFKVTYFKLVKPVKKESKSD